jgi:acyl dehydratase
MIVKKKFNLSLIKCGDFAEISQKMTLGMTKNFSKISKDFNRIHLDKDYALKSRFKGQIIHGMMAVSLFSGIFGTTLPGEGCVYKSQNINFRRAIYIGETVRARVEVSSVDLKKRIIKFKTTCFVKHKVVINGEAELFIF